MDMRDRELRSSDLYILARISASLQRNLGSPYRKHEVRLTRRQWISQDSTEKHHTALARPISVGVPVTLVSREMRDTRNEKIHAYFQVDNEKPGSSALDWMEMTLNNARSALTARASIVLPPPQRRQQV